MADDFELSFACNEDVELFRHFIQFVVGSGSNPHHLAIATAHKVSERFQCEDDHELFEDFIDLCARQGEAIEKNKKESQQRHASAANRTTPTPDVDIVKVLLRMDAYMRKQQIRCIDLFRQRNFNISFEKGDNKLDVGEFKKGLLLMGMELSRGEVQVVVNHLDSNGDGEIDVQELDTIMKQARREAKERPELHLQREENMQAPVAKVVSAVTRNLQDRVPQRPSSSSATRKAAKRPFLRPVTAGAFACTASGNAKLDMLYVD
jgi:hypothetical protein